MIGFLFFLIIVLGVAISGLFFLFNSVANKIDELCDLMKDPCNSLETEATRVAYLQKRVDNFLNCIERDRNTLAEVGKVLYKVQCDVEDLQEKTKR